MKPGWAELDGVSADRLWLRPMGLISGRAAAEAIASGHARPLTGPSLAFSLLAALGLGSDRRPISVTSSIAELEVWIAGAGARFAQRIQAQLAFLSAPRPPWARIRSRSPGRHGRPQCDARQLLRRRTVV